MIKSCNGKRAGIAYVGHNLTSMDPFAIDACGYQ